MDEIQKQINALDKQRSELLKKLEEEKLEGEKPVLHKDLEEQMKILRQEMKGMVSKPLAGLTTVYLPSGLAFTDLAVWGPIPFPDKSIRTPYLQGVEDTESRIR